MGLGRTAKGISVTLEEPIYRGDYAENSGYVDHANELEEFLDAVCKDEDKLVRFLFSGFSFIITGNDNDDGDVNINVTYAYYEYYKGN